MSDKIKILAIESSCDETAAAVVEDGRCVKSNIISSQIELHKLYGGVVPEIASRKHVEKVNFVVREALKEAGETLDSIDAIAVTYGPGLVGALLVGVAEAKALAFAKKKPLVGVHHIEGHICANYIEHPDLEPPFLCLVVSGGHTHLVDVKDYGKYEIIGCTRDDAAGEAFDKVARAIGLGYPGGPKIEALAKEGDKNAIPFPRAKVNDSKMDFSFSGLKSSVLNYLNKCDKKVFLEVEPPNCEISKKRVSFYEKLGFSFNDFYYLQQPLNPGDSPFRLNIMSYPESIGEKEFEKYKKDIYRDVYGVEI